MATQEQRRNGKHNNVISIGSCEQDVVALVELLKGCAKKKDLCKGSRLHAHILNRGLHKKNSYVASSLINMYAKCGAIKEAEEVLQDLSVRDVVSWSTLIAGYVQEGQGNEALNGYEQMQREGISPNEVTFSCVLKACGNMAAFDKGKQIHNEVIHMGLLDRNVMLGTALVEMYAKCGFLGKAHKVLQELPFRNVACWNALIMRYARHEGGHEALNCFEQMRREDISPNEVTFVCILKACGTTGAVDKGKQIHDEIIDRSLLKKNIVLGNALVDMYAKCGLLAKAQQVLEELPARDLVSWNALISGYAKQGHGYEALNAFKKMQRDGFSPDEVTFTCMLKACGNVKAINQGKKLHDEIASSGFLKKNVVLGNALVDMYAKFGMLTQSRQVFENLHVRDVISWSTLIAAYVQEGQGDEALNCFLRMQRDGFSPNDVTFILVLKACGSIKAIDQGIQIHDEIVRRGLLERSIVLGNTLVDMYAKCGEFKKAEQVLKQLHNRNVVTWNALISGYTQDGQGHEALSCFAKMESEGICPNEVTFTCIVKIFAKAGDLDKGKHIHDEIVSRGLLEKSVILGNALIDMYAKSGALAKAQEVLEELHIRDKVSWSALIAGYVKEAQGHEALHCFKRMKREGFYPDWVTLMCVLKACASAGTIRIGKQIHEEIVNRGFLEKNVMLGNVLVDMYAKWGVLAVARQVLEELPLRDVVSWNSLIAGYAQHEQGQDALTCFEQMQREGLSPNEVTFICILKACSSVGAIHKGKQIHDVIFNGGFLQKNIMLGTTLVDMYAKCGALTEAQQVLKELSVRDIVSWSALITGYAQEGQGHEALNCFEGMQSEGFSPDAIAFLSALNACTHSGKLNEVQSYYDIMSTQYGITPKLEHQTCMVVGFGCTGNFDKAMSLIRTIPLSNDPKLWLALLGACRKWANVNLGRLAFDEAMRIDNNLAAAYMLMSNIYAAAGMQEDAENIEAMRVKTKARAQKKVGKEHLG